MPDDIKETPAVNSKAPPGMTRRADGSFGFAPGNQLWKVALRSGLRPKLYVDPIELLEAVCGYFNWLEENSLEETKLVTYEGASSLQTVPKMRAATLSGLCLYLGISRESWGEWRRGEKRPEMADVVEFAEKFIHEQKFTGAAAGLLNPSIISRDLGLVDKQQIEGKTTVVLKGDDADL